MLTKGNFTRDEWNHLLCLFNISHFSSTNCLEVMSKTTQDAGEERVTAKSKPMMILVSWCSVRNPYVFASTASESPEKTKSESQNVLVSSLNEQQPRMERLVMSACTSNYSEWNIDDKWSCQEWNSDDRLWHRHRIELSPKSRSFFHRVNDRVRKILDQSSKDAMQDSNKNSSDMVNVSVFNIGSICIHRKDFFRQFTLHQKYREQSLDEADVRQIWKVDSATIKCVVEWLQLIGKILHGEDYLWSMLKLSSVSRMQRFTYVFRFCVLSWRGESEPSIKYCLGRTLELVQRFTTVQNFGHNWRRADVIRVEYFTGFTTLQLVVKVPEFINKMDDPAQFQGRIISMSMFNDITWGTKDNEQECIANATLVSLFAKKNSSRMLDILRTWIKKEVVFYLHRQITRRLGQSRWIDDDKIRRKRTPSFPCHESIVPRNA